MALSSCSSPTTIPRFGLSRKHSWATAFPSSSFAVDDVRAEWTRLRALGVRFVQEPTEMGPVTTAVLDDTCGNLIQIAHRA